MRSHTFLVGVSFALVMIALFAVLGVISPSYQKCVTNDGHDEVHHIVLLGYNLNLFLRCEGTFIDENNNTITALATVIIATFTGTLWYTTTAQGRFTRSLIDLARDEFNATHRPEIRLKHLWIASADGQHFVGSIESQQPITIRIDMVNVGDTEAFINLINFVVLIIPVGTRLPQRPPYNEPGIPQHHIGVRLDRGITFTHPIPTGRILTQEEIARIRNGDVRLYFVGTIGYWDASRRLRQTAFCRYLQFQSLPAGYDDYGRFQKDDDPDYEYQD